MPVRPPTYRPRGDRAQRNRTLSYDRQRGTATERGYDARWRKASRQHLVVNPLCEYCDLDGVVTAASLVDHLYPHRRFAGIFWMSEWWVSACRACHDGFKQRIEGLGGRALDDLARRLGRSTIGQMGGGPKV